MPITRSVPLSRRLRKKHPSGFLDARFAVEEEMKAVVSFLSPNKELTWGVTAGEVSTYSSAS